MNSIVLPHRYTVHSAKDWMKDCWCALVLCLYQRPPKGGYAEKPMEPATAFHLQTSASKGPWRAVVENVHIGQSAFCVARPEADID
jgi:hypothetical protein